MVLNREQYSYMTDYIKREYGYSPDWCKKVSGMADDQVFAIFCRLSAKEKMQKHPTRKNAVTKIESTRPKNEQITIWDLLKGEVNV